MERNAVSAIQAHAPCFAVFSVFSVALETPPLLSLMHPSVPLLSQTGTPSACPLIAFKHYERMEPLPRHLHAEVRHALCEWHSLRSSCKRKPRARQLEPLCLPARAQSSFLSEFFACIARVRASIPHPASQLLHTLLTLTHLPPSSLPSPSPCPLLSHPVHSLRHSQGSKPNFKHPSPKPLSPCPTPSSPAN